MSSDPWRRRGGDDAFYVGFTTFSGRRSYLFYAESMEWLQSWGGDHAEDVAKRDVTVFMNDDPGWDVYQDLVRRAVDAMAYMQVLMKVIEHFLGYVFGYLQGGIVPQRAELMDDRHSDELPTKEQQDFLTVGRGPQHGFAAVNLLK